MIEIGSSQSTYNNESKGREKTDEEIVDRVKRGLLRSINELSSREGNSLLRFADSLEIGITEELARGVGATEEDIAWAKGVKL
jgi:hypothetical protein